MPTLYLLRHAKSSWDEAGVDDIDRPLAPRGRGAAADMAVHMRRHGISPAMVLCSPARRTRETLELIAPALPKRVITLVDDGLYGADAGDLLERLRRIPGDVPSAILIGHNPGIGELALRLARGHGTLIDRVQAGYPTGALTTLEVRETGWAGLAPRGAELTAFVAPRELGG